MLGLCFARAHSLLRPGHQTPCLQRQLIAEKRSEYYLTRRAVLNCTLPATSAGEYSATETLWVDSVAVSLHVCECVCADCKGAHLLLQLLVVGGELAGVHRTTTYVMLAKAAMAFH
jgi:hypothetical protein